MNANYIIFSTYHYHLYIYHDYYEHEIIQTSLKLISSNWIYLILILIPQTVVILRYFIINYQIYQLYNGYHQDTHQWLLQYLLKAELEKRNCQSNLIMISFWDIWMMLYSFVI